MTKMIKKSVVVQVPVSTAYSQWTRFEEYPRFMGGVKEVKRLDDNQLYWTAKIAGELREWQAEVTELVPNSKVAWAATEGPKNAAVVTLTEVSAGRTRVHIEFEYDLGAFAADEEDELVVMSGLVEGDLERFAGLVESESGTEAIPLPFAPGPSAEEEGMVAPGYHPAEVPEDGITIPMAPGRALKGHQADTPLNPD